MATTFINWRASALASVCPSILSDRSVSMTQALVLGQPAVVASVVAEAGHALPVFNNSIGATAAAAAAGTTTPSRIEMASAKLRDQRNDFGKVSKGGYARGIPPRGRQV
jgi:hypothetical protein